LISDVVLPDGYGLDLADQILARSPGLPVIICSGYADDRSRWPLIKDKGLPFIQKPFTRMELLDTVKSAMTEKAENN
ncbi:MAG: response regulator, partial [Desulfobia sp.]